jgi:hypothetical protein
MVIDEAQKMMYIFGGRVESPVERDAQQQYSGMYSFHLDNHIWTQILYVRAYFFGRVKCDVLLSADPARHDGTLSTRSNIHSRTGAYGRTLLIFPLSF